MDNRNFTPAKMPRWRNSFRTFLPLLFLTAIFYVDVSGQTVRYVREGHSGSGTGWNDASGDLQEMINASASGDTIFVAAGTYKPNRRADALSVITPNNPHNAFVPKSGVKIYGGFNPDNGITHIGHARIAPGVGSGSILSGDFNGNDIVTGSGGALSISGNTENAYRVVIFSGVDTSTVFDGFTVTGANARAGSQVTVNGNNISSGDGGGIMVSNASPLINRVAVFGNVATYGAGIYNGGAASFPVITNTAIFKNSVGTGGGGIFSYGSSPTISNVTISGNIGPGIHNLYVSSIVITNSVVWGNWHSSGILSVGNSPSVSYCIVQGGHAGTNNRNIDPSFVNAVANDYRLSACSPAINAGNNGFAPLGSDMAGNTRIYGSTIDLGAFEFQGNPINISISNPVASANPACGNTELTVSPADPDVDLYWQTSAGGASLAYNAATPLTVNSSGTYYVRGVHTVANCWLNSVSSIGVTVNPVYNETLASVGICPGSSYTLADGTVVDSSGTYTVTVPSVSNCDSTVTVYLNVNPPEAPVWLDDPVICQGASSVLVETSTLEIILDFGNNLECDDSLLVDAVMPALPPGAVVTDARLVITDGVAISPSWQSEIRVLLRGAVNFPGGGVRWTPGGTNNSPGPLTPNPTILTGQQIIDATYSYTISPAGGIVTLKISETFNNPEVSPDAVFGNVKLIINYTSPPVSWYNAATGGDSLGTGFSMEAVGTSLLPDTDTPGAYTFYAQTRNGACVSSNRTPVTVTVNPVYNDTLPSVTICAADSYMLADSTVVDSSGTYTVTVSSVLNCDSTVTVHLTVNPVYNDTLPAVTICSADSYMLADGRVVDSSGIYTVTVPSVSNCDSTVTVHLTVNPLYNDTLVAGICPGSSYTLADGRVVDSSGTYTVTVPSVLNCDSTVTVHLTVNSVYNDTLPAVTICSNDSYTLADGTVVDSSGTYTVTVPSVLNCDSTVTVTLDVLPGLSEAQTVNDTLCSGDSYTFPDGTAIIGISDTVYTSYFQNILGCDSVIVTTLRVFPSYTSTLSPTICFGDVYILPDGTDTASAGTYVFPYSTIRGCDSTVTVHLTVNSVYNDTVPSVTICSNDSYMLADGTVVDSSGTYTVTVPSVLNCDSTVTVTLDVLPGLSEAQMVNDTLCSGDSYTFPDGTTIMAMLDTVYTSFFQNIAGCDSAIVTTLRVFPSYTSTLSPSICPGDVYRLPDGTDTASAGTYVFPYSTDHGCDSTITVHLTVNPVYNDTLATGICEGSFYTLVDGSAVDTAGTYTVTVASVAGCDSTITVVLSINSIYTDTVANSVCAGDSFTFPDGTEITAQQNTVYASLLQSTSGCDSTVVTELTVNPLPLVNLGSDITVLNPPVTLDAGSGYVGYLWSTGVGTQTISVTQNGTYSVTVENDLGCKASDNITVTFTVSIADHNHNGMSVSLFPNPASERFAVNVNGYKGYGTVTFDLVDALGRVVITKSVVNPGESFITEIDVASLPSGAYTLIMRNKNTEIFLRTIIAR